MSAIEKHARFRVSEILAKDFIPLVATLFYLGENNKGLNAFIKREFGEKPSAMTRPLQEAGLIVLKKGSFKLTKLGLKTSEAL